MLAYIYSSIILQYYVQMAKEYSNIHTLQSWYKLIFFIYQLLTLHTYPKN